MTSYLKKKNSILCTIVTFFFLFQVVFRLWDTLRNDMKDELNEQKQNCRRNYAWHAEEGGNGQ